jgi:hypothetical protein
MLKHPLVYQRPYVCVRLFILLMLSSAMFLLSCKKKKPGNNEGGGNEKNACGFKGWPTPQTVGLPAGTPLQVVTKDMHTTKDGQVIEGLDMRARIYVVHKNVTIRNCILLGDYWYAVYSKDGGNDGPLLIENCDITGGIASSNNVTFRNNHFYAPAGGFKNDGLVLGSNNIVIENNLIHNLKGREKAHMDGIQIMTGNNITIRNNWIELADNPETGEDGGPNGAIFLKSDTGPTSNVTVECNMIIMRDGWYPLRIERVTGNIVVRHNRWRHGSFNDIPVAYDYSDAPKVWEDNAFEDGKAIPNPL